MLSKLKSFKAFSNWGTQQCVKDYSGKSFPFINGGCYLLSNFYSTLAEPPKIDDLVSSTEPPELPSWVKLMDEGNPLAEMPEDDFVLPTVIYWTDNNDLGRKTIQQMVTDITDSDVGRVSRILKNCFATPDDVVQAFSGFSVNVSEGLCEQVLKRFNNHWIPAFGFFKWAKWQMGFKHSPSLYNSMVDILGKAKKFDLMWGLVEEMDQLGGGYITLETLTKVMRRLARAGRYKDAVDAFRQTDRFGVNKNVETMNLLMDALVKENGVEHAQEVYLEFKNHIPPNSHSYNVLIHGWCKARKVEEARRAMEEMERDGFHPDVISYTCFVETYCREKDFRKVDAILEEMQGKGCFPNVVTYTIHMHALGKAKEINKALEVYEKMKKNGCVPDSSFYSSLIYILSKAGRLKDAREVFDDMPNQGVAPDVLTYKSMITALCEHSQEENALKLLREIEKSNCKPNVEIYAPLLKMCCKKERMKVLSFLMNHMLENDVSPDLGTYTLLVQGLCKCSKLERAASFFEEMIARGFVPKDGTYDMLRKELENKGVDKAKQQIEELMLRVRSEKDAHPFCGYSVT